MPSVLTLTRALADPSRLRILSLLRPDPAAPGSGRVELAVGEIARVLGQSQPRVSRHVRILAEAGLILRRREGSWQFLMLAEGEMIRHLLTAADLAGPDPEEAATVACDRRRLARVRAEREADARALFAARAPQWQALGRLHVPDTVVEAMIRQILGGRPVGRLVDVGTGTGRIAAVLGPAASSVTGIDRSPDMLRLARAALAPLPMGASLMQGDATALPLDDAVADTIVLHQVLHFLPQPGVAIAEAARVLAPGGRVLIVDFASHALDRLRRDAGHARLGFDDQQIAGWCKDAGLDALVTKTLPGDPLTITLWLATRPPATDAAHHRIAA